MPDVSVTLSADEALVLLDWLAIENEVEKVAVDPAVRQAMWNLEALLERVVAAVVAEDYAEQVDQAKARLTPSTD
ncbi:hypothetical protein [Auraticoccus monumenti]|uniref:Uncharacterized protein n=1 Tax=Auraticoccus monumenti TaxID=675864 RepID=A0A1G6TB00_9ACTN|nr:hypothetical protein [Auraticoccus monumenti]SDD25485.1 hypothetical protein SAMN04489747_0558 [Auraticoccus monumenti]